MAAGAVILRFPRRRFSTCLGAPSPTVASPAVDPVVLESIELAQLISILEELASLSRQSLSRLPEGSSEWEAEHAHLNNLLAELLGFEGRRERVLGGAALRVIEGGRNG